ncbi:unnamed protein product [Prorocentrum cordatum]|uniref:Uncharacterized protein n=1 Tax=Prorocentrum cordatum TaxID=2364126 RepID=A0ABN9YEM4_9DINO|nr:unnamed protein product [Polarella glacialis]
MSTSSPHRHLLLLVRQWPRGLWLARGLYKGFLANVVRRTCRRSAGPRLLRPRQEHVGHLSGRRRNACRSCSPAGARL